MNCASRKLKDNAVVNQPCKLTVTIHSALNFPPFPTQQPMIQLSVDHVRGCFGSWSDVASTLYTLLPRTMMKGMVPLSFVSNQHGVLLIPSSLSFKATQVGISSLKSPTAATCLSPILEPGCEIFSKPPNQMSF